MGKINIISNISSKTHAGTPCCKLDQKKCKIEKDKIVFSIEGEHNLQIGYLYTNDKDGRLINYDENIFFGEEEEWYLYRVPLLLDGKGKMKKISKRRFAVEATIRKLVNNIFFLMFCLVVLLFIQALRS